MTNRQPKGTPVGGQFAEGRKPEGGDLRPADGSVLSIGDTIYQNGVAGVVVDVQPAVMHPTGEPTFDIQVDFSGTSGEPDFEPDAIDCPWFDQNELAVINLETLNNDANLEASGYSSSDKYKCPTCGESRLRFTPDRAERTLGEHGYEAGRMMMITQCPNGHVETQEIV